MDFGLPSNIIAWLRVALFVLGTIIGPGVPGLTQPGNTVVQAPTTENPAQAPQPSKPVPGVLGFGLQALALGLKAGQRNDER